MRVILLILALLSGCTTIDMHVQPPDKWPVLTERVHRVGFMEMQKLCENPYPVLLVQYFACARPDLVKGVCDIYLIGNDDTHLAHERFHCQGRDHPGVIHLLDYYNQWQRWVEQQRNAGLK